MNETSVQNPTSANPDLKTKLQTSDPNRGVEPSRELEDLWQQGQRPDIREFLQQIGKISPGQVVRILCVDQWHRWQQGDRVPAEVYLQMHPALSEAQDDAFDLVYGEFLLREELGEQPSLDHFLQRFPQYTLQLQRQAKVHEAIESGGTPDEPTVMQSVQPTGMVRTTEFAINPAAEPDWPTIPGYTIMSKLGQGGMGQVFKAMQNRLDRVVALKVIKQECLLQEPKAAKRFQREAQAAAGLNHPNIIVVYDFNQVDNTYYIAMEYVDGVDLDQMVREGGPLPVERACDYVRQAALGLQEAHEQANMVHRDIKPSNLLIALPKKEVGISGYYPIPGGKSKGSPAGGAGGSPSGPGTPPGALTRPTRPEGQLKILDMGMALLLHASDPDSVQHTMQGTLMGTPDYISPEQAMDCHQVDIRADLYSLGCTFYFLLTGRSPYAEYPLLKKLMMHQAGEPKPLRVLAPDVPVNVEAIVNKLMAKSVEDRYQTPGELVEALDSLANQKQTPAGLAVDLDAEIERILKSRESEPPGEPGTAMQGPGHPGGTGLPGGFTQEWTGAKAKTRREGPELATRVQNLKGHKGWVMTVAFAPNRRALAAGPVNGNVRLWEITGRKPCERAVLQTSQSEVHSLAFSPNSEILAAGSGRLDGLIWLWNLAEMVPKPIGVLRGHSSPVETLTFSPDGALLASGGCDKTVRLWEIAGPEAKERAVFKGHQDHIKSLAFARDSKTVLSGSLDGTVRLWRKTGMWSRDVLEVLEGRWGPIHTLALSRDGKLLAFGGLDQRVHLFSLAGDKFKAVAEFRGHLGVIRQVHFQPDGKELASVCDCGRVIFWNLETKEKARERQVPGGMTGSSAFTTDTRYLAVGTSDGMVDLYRLYEKKKD
jgi:serine/threonine-protein kinase